MRKVLFLLIVVGAASPGPRVSRAWDAPPGPDAAPRCPTCNCPLIRGIGLAETPPDPSPRCPHGHGAGLASPQSPAPSAGVPGPSGPAAGGPSAAPGGASPPATAGASTPGIGGGPEDGGLYGSSSGPTRHLDDSPSAILLLGDQAPIMNLPTRPPEGAPVNSTLLPKAKTVNPWTRSFKITDNQSPLPLDRVYFNFNYFNNLNYAVIRGFPRSGIKDLQAYRYLMGFEKTFWDGRASVGLRDSLNTMSVSARNGGQTTTAFGDLNLYAKVVAWSNLEPSARPAVGRGPSAAFGSEGGLVSVGLSLTVPTGPGNFAGSPNSKSFRDTQIQPFVGYYFARGRFFIQGFEAIDVATDRNDVTLIFSDLGVGYYVYRSLDPAARVAAIAPTFEVHVNNPVNHRGVFRNASDPSGTADTVDLTGGVNTLFGRRSLLTLGVATPVTGPRPFSLEAIGMLNVFFGGRRKATPAVAVPFAGP